jgi:hypothetical protein
MGYNDDDSRELHYDCTTYTDVRVHSSIAAWIALAAVSYATAKNLWGDDRRLRYPGRLVTCFGGAILLFDLCLASSWLMGFKQLDWGKKSHYHFYHDDDDEQFWFQACNVQGSIVQFSLTCTAAYCTWLSVAFFNVVQDRFTLNRVIVETGDVKRNRLNREIKTHAFILIGSAGVAAFTAFNGDIGANAGIIACWIQGGSQDGQNKQIYYFYVWMIIAVGVSMVFSGFAIVQLRRVLRSAGNGDMWSQRHRPLRRVVYGHLSWAVSTVAVISIPIAEFIYSTYGTCELATVNAALFGVYFLFDYSVAPYLLERMFERIRESTASIDDSRSDYRSISGGISHGFMSAHGNSSNSSHAFRSAGSSSLGASSLGSSLLQSDHSGVVANSAHDSAGSEPQSMLTCLTEEETQNTVSIL